MESARGLPFGLSVFAVGAAALAVITPAATVRIVAQGSVCPVERFGRYARRRGAGLALIVPFIERVGRRDDVMEQGFDAARASYEVSSLDLAATTPTIGNIRTVVGAMDLDQRLDHRDGITERRLRVTAAAAAPWGMKINRIESEDIPPPPDLAGAIARRMTAEREKRAAILEAGGRREAALRDAEAHERSAEVEAATGMVSRAIAEGDIAAANVPVAEKSVDAVRALATAPNQRVAVVPIRAEALAATLGGIGELPRAVFGEASPAASRRGPRSRCRACF